MPLEMPASCFPYRYKMDFMTNQHNFPFAIGKYDLLAIPQTISTAKDSSLPPYLYLVDHDNKYDNKQSMKLNNHMRIE